MNDESKKMLNVLISFLEVAFSNSSMDRKKLHEIEWEVDNSCSILGEIEIRADTVLGITKSYLKREPGNINDLVEKLGKKSVYQSDHLVSWLANHGDTFPDFTSYIMAIENLRINTIISLKKL